MIADMERRWPDDWDDQRLGAGCPMCADMGADRKDHGVRVFDGRWSDAYLGRYPLRPGYVYVIWKGRHVAEPTELTVDELAGFWDEVAVVGRAVEACYKPAKVNYLVLGNGVPHLHVHIVPRPYDDPMAGGPIEIEAFSFADQTPLADDELDREATALREIIGGRGR
jgi:diadenosine tetraphosphate (Ap4A) HIT family hydrolase